MPLSDLQIVDLLQSQYSGAEGVFDVVQVTDECSWAFKSLPDEDIICFQGSANIPDWIRDFEGEMVFLRNIGGVHLGMYSPLPKVLEIVKTLIQPEKPKKICGHSLGGGETNIFTVMLDEAGYSVMETITFGCPTALDAEACGYLAPYPNRSYWNYRDALHHDPVGNVAVHIPGIAPYMPRQKILVNSPPPSGDSWGDVLGWHHLQRYREGLVQLGIQ
jgi:hypothetical protein